MNTEKLIDRIEILIEHLEKGTNVTRRSLRFVLNDDEFEAMEKDWLEEKKYRSYRPKEIVEYGKRLKKAIVCFSKADNSKKNCKSLMELSESLAESACERLEEIVYTNPNMRFWLDRDFILTINIDKLPRPIWWKKKPEITIPVSPFYTLKDTKLEVLYSKLSKLKNEHSLDVIESKRIIKEIRSNKKKKKDFSKLIV